MTPEQELPEECYGAYQGEEKSQVPAYPTRSTEGKLVCYFLTFPLCSNKRKQEGKAERCLYCPKPE